MFFKRQEIVLQFVIRHPKGVKDLSQCRLIILGYHPFLPSEPHALRPTLDGFCQSRLVQLSTFLNLIDIYCHSP